MTKQEQQSTRPHLDNHADTVRGSTSQGSAQCMARHAECSKVGHFWKVCCSRRSRVVNKTEQELSQEYTEDGIEMVSIN